MILIGTDEGIYRWFEGCGWPIFHSLQDRSIARLASPGAGTLVAIDRKGEVLESDNNGQTWRVLPSPRGTGSAATTPVTLAVWGEPASIVLATQPVGFYRRFVGAPLPRAMATSSGAGRAPAMLARARAMAEETAARLSAGRATAAAVRPADAWEAIGKPEVPKGKVAASAAITTIAAGVGDAAPWFAAIRGAGLWRSVNSGTTWQHCPGLTDEVLALRAIPSKPGGVVAATAAGCRVSHDGGQTWEGRSAGLEKAPYVAAIEVKPDEPDILMAGAAPAPPAGATARPQGSGFALYESNNGGKSWTQVKRSFPEDLYHDTIADIRYDPASPDNVIVALGSGELWVSRNAGAYWSPLARQTRSARALCAVG